MADEEIKDQNGGQPPKDGADNPPKPPSNSDDGQGKQAEDLPEKFKGKSATEIAKSYIELEKKIGENENVKKDLAQWQALGKVIKGNPKLKEAIEEEILKISGAPSQNKDTKDEPKVQQDPETRQTLENQIVADFEKEIGLKSLASEKRDTLYKKVGTELMDMLDPGGTKSYREVITSVPLTRLRSYLDKAYKLATADDAEERGRVKALSEARQNNEAMFSSMPSAGGKTGEGLSPEEKAAAKKMGISEEKYLKNKKELAEGK